jgi:hypothetical protein
MPSMQNGLRWLSRKQSAGQSRKPDRFAPANGYLYFLFSLSLGVGAGNPPVIVRKRTIRMHF